MTPRDEHRKAVAEKTSELPPVRHIVWDWNCTLLDDFHISVEATAVACAELGRQGVDADEYRRRFTRPVRRFYETLLGRQITDAEWNQITVRFHEHFATCQDSAGLRADAVVALALAQEHSISQSLLSLGEHSKLVGMVDRLSVGSFFCHVQGAAAYQRTGTKYTLLKEHLANITELLPAPATLGDVLLIGDTEDDAEAALEADQRCVLLSDGCFDADIIDGRRVMTADSLIEAVRLGISLVRQPHFSS